MNSEVRIPDNIKNRILRLDKIILGRVFERLEQLQNNPNLGKPLTKLKLWSLGIGKFRILYEIDYNIGKIDIVRFDHRGKVYDYSPQNSPNSSYSCGNSLFLNNFEFANFPSVFHMRTRTNFFAVISYTIY